jgi:hypothetical protein
MTTSLPTDKSFQEDPFPYSLKFVKDNIVELQKGDNESAISNARVALEILEMRLNLGLKS